MGTAATTLKGISRVATINHKVDTVEATETEKDEDTVAAPPPTFAAAARQFASRQGIARVSVHITIRIISHPHLFTRVMLLPHYTTTIISTISIYIECTPHTGSHI
jgi:hypothetical protein